MLDKTEMISVEKTTLNIIGQNIAYLKDISEQF